MAPLFRHILVPIDGSEPSLQAVQMTLRIVELCPACKTTVLYVIDKLVLNELVRFSKHNEKRLRPSWKNRDGATWSWPARPPSARVSQRTLRHAEAIRSKK